MNEKWVNLSSATKNDTSTMTDSGENHCATLNYKLPSIQSWQSIENSLRTALMMTYLPWFSFANTCVRFVFAYSCTIKTLTNVWDLLFLWIKVGRSTVLEQDTSNLRLWAHVIQFDLFRCLQVPWDTQVLRGNKYVWDQVSNFEPSIPFGKYHD